MSSLGWLDDSEWSIDPEDEPTRWWIPVVGIVLACLLFAGQWAYAHYQCKPAGFDYYGHLQEKCSIVWKVGEISEK